MSFGDRAGDALKKSVPWITSQRWYGDKAREVGALSPEVVIPVDVGTVDAALVVARLSYTAGPDVRYFIPLASNIGTQTRHGGASLDFRDAFSEPAFLAWFLAGFDEQRSIPGDEVWQWRALTDGGPPFSTLNFAKARVLTAEQSNTTVVFDDRYVGKVFRRLQTGLNPDLEIGEFLSRDETFPHVPKLFGVIEVLHHDEVTAIAAIQQFVPNKGDGWLWLLELLERLNAETRESSLDAVHLLGQRTGELHVALASDNENPAFAPEAFAEQDAQDLTTRIVAEMQESVEGLVRHVPPPELAALHGGIGRLMAGAHSLVGTQKIRVHGDYHLGQTLRTLDDDFCLIDFEGEPSRPIAQRRMKQSALKDVAGMLRSLDYAVATVISRTHVEAQRDALHAWLDEARDAFIAGFRAGIDASDVPLVPEDDTHFREGLDILIVEKALYEVRYELNNRPDWLPIPLNALRRMAGLPLPR
jgi:maltokinase